MTGPNLGITTADSYSVIPHYQVPKLTWYI